MTGSFEEMTIAIVGPDELRETLAAVGTWTIVAEWDLEVPLDDVPSQGYDFPSAVLTEQLRALLQVFDWIRVRSLEVAWADRPPTMRTIDPGDAESWDRWLAGPLPPRTGGAEIILDLLVSYPSANTTREAWMGPAGKITLTREASNLTVTFSLCLNLFTDRATIFTGRSGDRLSAATIDLGPSAAGNRARLASSLRSWEAASGGTIDNWETEKLEEDSVTRYGVAGDAVEA